MGKSDFAPIAITGAGAVSALGHDRETTLSRVFTGEGGIDFDVELSKTLSPDLISTGRVPVDLNDLLPYRDLRSSDRTACLALLAAREAYRHADLPLLDPDRLAVCLSSGMSGLDAAEATLDKVAQNGLSGISVHTVPRIMPNGPAARVSVEFQARAGTYSPVSACASGLEAVVHGCRLIHLGLADVVVAGGSDSLMDYRTIRAFSVMRALARGIHADRTSVPFDVGRFGFNMAEGAGVLILEPAGAAERRGAKVLARITGASITSDGYNIVAPEPSGHTQSKAMLTALKAAGCAAQDVTAVFAHATGTAVGDAAEASAVRMCFGDVASQPLVTATKSFFGHTLGASGVLSLIVAAESGLRNSVPGIHGLTLADPELHLNVAAGLRGMPRGAGSVSMINAFGFGGQNVSLLLTTNNDEYAA